MFPKTVVRKSYLSACLYLLALLLLFLPLRTIHAQEHIPSQLLLKNTVADSLHLVSILTKSTGRLEYACGVGDLNDDGYEDMLTTDYITTDIYLGNAQFTFSVYSHLAGGYYLPAGDVNGDGFDDLLQVMPDSIATVYFRMRLYICYGGDVPGERVDSLYTLPWRTQGYYLYKLGKLGDINGDGYDDMVYSNSMNAQNDGMGYVYFFYGGKEIRKEPSFILKSKRFAQFDLFGYTISGIGDRNHDGYDDFIITAPAMSVGATSDTSKAYIYHGGVPQDTLPVSILLPPVSSRTRSYFTMLSAAGDINRDGNPDFLLSEADGHDAYLCLGNYDPLIFTSFDGLNGLDPGAGGDINNDGYDDFIFANDNQNFNGNIQGGLVKVYFGRPMPDEDPNIVLASYNHFARFGYYSQIIKDFNGDGYDDVIIGEPDYQAKGRLYVYSYRKITGTDNQNRLPIHFSLEQNFPNPFNPVTKIQCTLPYNGKIRLMVFDVLGNEVVRLADGYYGAGNHTFTFNAVALATGLYTYRLEFGGNVLVKKMVLIK